MSTGPSIGRILGDWSLEPAALAVCALAACLYLAGVRRLHGAWPSRRTASFMGGLAALVVALLSGLDAYDDELLSIHAVQHLLLMFAAPALLLWGAPVRLALAAAGGRARRRAIGALLGSSPVRALTRPAVGFTAFAAAVLLWEIPAPYELALRNPLLHDVEHASFFWCGLLFLAPLIAADPLHRPPRPLARFSWMMAAMTVMAAPAGLLLFASRSVYGFYSITSPALGLSALADQREAGVLMLVGGGVAMSILAMATAIGAMVEEERRQRLRELHADRRAAA